MKTVLCYGDSNTWGFDPATRTRFPPHVRWTGVLGQRLGDGYQVIEEGLNGRTTRWDDPIEPDRNGLAYLRPCVESHQPLDLIVIMLGTNDLKRRFDLSASDIAQSAAGVAEMGRRFAYTPAGAHAKFAQIGRATRRIPLEVHGVGDNHQFLGRQTSLLLRESGE